MIKPPIRPQAPPGPGTARSDKVARFRQLDMDDPHVHHDALEFPGGQIVMVTRLMPGQQATVLQLPAPAPDHGRDRQLTPAREREVEPIAS